MEEIDMLSNKKTSAEIHRLAAQYSQNLLQYRSFFGKLNTIETVQYNVSKKILKTRNLTKIRSILQEECDVDGNLTITSDLLRKDSSNFSFQLLKGLLILFTFPISFPLLVIWSQLTRGTFNFLKPNNSIIAEKIWAFSYGSHLHQLNTSTHDISTNSKPILNTTLWINNMLNMTEWHHRLSTSKTHLSKNTFTPLHNSDVEYGNVPINERQLTSTNNRPLVIDAKEEKFSSRMASVFVSARASISSFGTGFSLFSGKPKFKSLSPLEEANSNCDTLLENIISDLTIVTDAISKFSQEQRFLNNKIILANAEKNRFNPSVSPASSFHKTPTAYVSDLPTDKQECTEMLLQYSELMKTYPKNLNEFDTLESIESFHAALEQHHEKVISIAERLVPELSNLLNQARINDVTHALAVKL